MNLQEIKQAVKEGKTVHWSSSFYSIICDKKGQWLIKGLNGYSIGLTWNDDVTLNGKESDFYIAE